MNPYPPHLQDLLRKLDHDIRGRMNTINLYTELIDESTPIEEQLEQLGHIEHACDKLLELLDRLDQIA